MVGGSLGRALLAKGLAEEVIGYDQNPGVLRRALALGAVTGAAETVASAVRGCDLVVLAAPVLAAQELLAKAAPYLAPGCIVTDVCSTKAEIVARAAKVLPPSVSFVGGHPMAGSEKQGVEALAENLFENAVYVLCGGEEAARAKIKALVRGLGALPVEMSPERHDYVVAAVSHLPHLAAVALTNTVAGLQGTEELLLLAAGGFRDTTRIAMGSPQMWREICLSNREKLLLLLDKLAREVEAVRQLLAAKDGEGLFAYFRAAGQFRRKVPVGSKGILPQVFNLYVYVKDHPGVIGEVAGLVGKSGINIAEVELLRVREVEGGPLRFGFLSATECRRAAEVLAAANYCVEVQEG